jgi:N-methylhydantoinase A
VVLGYIDPAYFLGGRLALDADAARQAIQTKVAEPLAMTLERAAWAILAVANEHMVTAVRDITINQGIDPRDSVLVAGGGAAGLTMAKLADELGCRQVLIPRTAAALSATGGLFGDVVTEFTASHRTQTSDFDFDAVNEALESLDRQVDEFFGRMGVAPGAQVREYVAEARYPYQIWELDVPLPNARFGDAGDVTALERAFHATHERVFAVSEPGQRVECLTWKARASVRLPKPAIPTLATNGAGPGAEARSRPTWWGDDDPAPAPIHQGEVLAARATVKGPAIVELATTTIVVYPEWSLEISDRGDFLMTRPLTDHALDREAA